MGAGLHGRLFDLDGAVWGFGRAAAEEPDMERDDVPIEIGGEVDIQR